MQDDDKEQLAYLILFAAMSVSVAIAFYQIKCLHDFASWCNWIRW